MVGPVALIGAGEFLPAMADIDRELLAGIAARRPRVVVLPTASWPDGEATFRRWAAMGVEHFGALGAEVEAVLVRDRADADDAAFVQAVGEADIVYLSGGHPGHLLATLRGSAVWDAACRANERGAALVGCSAGAMVLGVRQIEWRRRLRRMPFPVRYPESLAMVPGCAV
ncbi:MAG TPA: Type 1 glutamine amidotransferase-like domain-containing protein, partial [Candidatus Limnocylindrales bacterium]